MSRDEADDRRWASRRPGAYAVGYGKPPEGSRFRPGRSGNPKGRPRGAKNRKPSSPALNQERLQGIILQEAYRTVKVNDPTGRLTIPIAQAVIRSLAVNAAKGLQRSQKLFTELLGTTERDRKQLSDRLLESAIIYKTEWEQELDRRRRLGLTGAAPLPHPDDVVINMQTGMVEFKGPITPEEFLHWKEAARQRDGIRLAIARYERLLRRERDAEKRADITAGLAVLRSTDLRFREAIGEWPHGREDSSDVERRGNRLHRAP